MPLRSTRLVLSFLAAGAWLSVAAPAAAQQAPSNPPAAQPPAQPPAGGGARRRANVIELNEITITGRVQKPVAAVDISRIAPKLSLTELRQPFLDQIEQALYRDPF